MCYTTPPNKTLMGRGTNSRCELVSVTWAVIFLAASSCSSCNRRISDPVSEEDRVRILMFDIKKAQDQCYFKRYRYCTLEELGLPAEDLWGHLSITSPTQANLGKYDFRLVLDSARYCVGALPMRRGIKTKAIWHDHIGREYYEKHPWRNVPPECDFLPD